MITREQIANLQPGDVVEMRDERWPEGTALRGPVWNDIYGLAVGWFYLRKNANGHHSLVVVSRAPRPVYVNHHRTEPFVNDMARDADDDNTPVTWHYTGCGSWGTSRGHGGFTWAGSRSGMELPRRLRLLVDGETGQVVPS